MGILISCILGSVAPTVELAQCGVCNAGHTLMELERPECDFIRMITVKVNMAAH